jgi:hypothetical protein
MGEGFWCHGWAWLIWSWERWGRHGWGCWWWYRVEEEEEEVVPVWLGGGGNLGLNWNGRFPNSQTDGWECQFAGGAVERKRWRDVRTCSGVSDYWRLDGSPSWKRYPPLGLLDLSVRVLRHFFYGDWYTSHRLRGSASAVKRKRLAIDASLNLNEVFDLGYDRYHLR